MTSILKIHNLIQNYGHVTALDGFSMELQKGEVLCLLGPSGCGKTSALRSIAGLETPQSGQIWIEDQLVTDKKLHVQPEERAVGFVFQDYALFPHLTIEKNIAFGIRKKPKSWQKEKIKALLETVGMSKYAKAYPHMLSGGEQQRIAIARALATEPSILLLDEPFSGLDARLRTQVRDEILHILKESGTSVVMVTHDAEEAMFMGDRILLMQDGKSVQAGTPEDLYSQPNSGFVAEFFGEINKVCGFVKNNIIISPIGLLPLEKEIADGAEVEIFVRPEALRLSEAREELPIYAQIMVCKRLGPTSFVHLTLHDRIDDKSWHLHARVPSYQKFYQDKSYHVEFDTEQIFVFAKAKTQPLSVSSNDNRPEKIAQSS